MVEGDTAMRQGILRRSRYSPGNMDQESLEALFVGRNDVMEDVLSRVVTSIEGPEKHYVLLVGPRGSGKTHLLSLAYHRLMDWLDTANARGSVALAMLNEEEWGVASYLDLLVRILRSLADQAPELASEIAGIYDRFSKSPVDAEAYALTLLRQHTHGRTLLLICENLVDLFRGLDDEGQKRWRATIQEDGNWTIVASTPSLFGAITLQDSPFYGFFTVRALERMDFDTGLELLIRKAHHEGKSDLVDFLRTPLGRARARAIHHLAAGNHRAYVVLFDFLDKESLGDLVDPFMHMIDDLTPYYQDRMRQLPPAQRKIVEFLSLDGKPTIIKDISTPCLMSQQTAAKQVSELESAGFVNRMRFGRYTFCELSEPLMRICIEVKDNRTRHFRLFVEFLRHWFTARELEQRQALFQRNGRIADVDSVHVEEAVKCTLQDRREPFVDALDIEAERCLEACDYKGLAEIQEKLVRDIGGGANYVMWVYALEANGDAQAAIAVGREGAAKYPDDASLQHSLACVYFEENRLGEALSAIDRSIALDGKEPLYLRMRADILLELEFFEETIQIAQEIINVDPENWYSFGQVIWALIRQGRLEDAESWARQLIELAPTEPEALRIVAGVCFSQRRLDRALELVDKALEIDVGDRQARLLRGLILGQMKDYRGASQELRRVAVHQPRSGLVYYHLAFSLLLSGDWEEAIDAAEQLSNIDPEQSSVHLLRGSAFLKLGCPEDGVAAYDKLLSTGDCASLVFAASQVRRIGDYASARRYLNRVAELLPDDCELWIERTCLHIDEGAFDAASDSVARVEALLGGSLRGRLFAARVAAGTEPLQVALDMLGPAIAPDEFESDEGLYSEAIARILTVSVRNFGPQHLSQGLVKLRDLLAGLLDQGVIGAALTQFLVEDVEDCLVGSLADWEKAIEELASSLADLPDCQIPIEMLQAAVRYTRTGDERHLLSLPLEKRQLLEEILPPSTDERAISWN